MTKACFYNETIADSISTEHTNGTSHAYAKAIFICLPSSHPFAEKEVYLNGKIKIGRTYMSAKQCRDKMFFDSKVLSKCHAVIWYDSGQFFLKDTKSSNGTFLNGNRLSVTLEESDDYQIFTDDVVQFGVEVTETTDNDKPNVHSSVYTLLKLFHPDGTPACRPVESEQTKAPCPNITMRQLSILHDCLKSSMNREINLKEKLSFLKLQLTNLEEITKKKWDFVIDEDLLLSKIETLQNRLESILALNSQLKNQNDETKLSILSKEIQALHEQKQLYQLEFKTIIKKAFDCKRIAEAEQQETEIKLNASLKEIKHLEDLVHKCKTELNLADSQITFLDEELKTYKLETKKLMDEKQMFKIQIHQLQENENVLNELVKDLKREIKDKEIEMDLKEFSAFYNVVECPNCLNSTKESRNDDLEHIQNTQHNQLPSSQSQLNNGRLPVNDERKFENCTDFFKCPINEQSSQTFLELLYAYLNESNDLNPKKMDRNEEILRHALSLLILENRNLIENLKFEPENHLPKQNSINFKNSINPITEINTLKPAKFTNLLERNESIVRNIQSMINKEKEIESLSKLVNEFEESLNDLKSKYNELELKVLRRGRMEEEIVRNDVRNVLDSVIEKVESKITQQDFDNTVCEFNKLQSDYNKLKLENAKLRKENESMSEDVTSLKEEFEMVSYQNKMAHLIALIPLTVLIVSLILSYLPWLSVATATKDV